MRIGLVVAEFNPDVTLPMMEVAKAHIDFLGGVVGPILQVSGVFDSPLALKTLLKRDDVDAAIVIGAVIEGETEHDEVVVAHSSRKAADLSVEYEKPVGLGISGPGMSRLQAHARVSHVKAAVEAVVKLQMQLESLE